MGGELEIPITDLDDIIHDYGLMPTHPLSPLLGYVDFSWISEMYDNNFTNVYDSNQNGKSFMAQDDQELDRVQIKLACRHMVFKHSHYTRAHITLMSKWSSKPMYNNSRVRSIICLLTSGKSIRSWAVSISSSTNAMRCLNPRLRRRAIAKKDYRYKKYTQGMREGHKLSNSCPMIIKSGKTGKRGGS